MNTLPVAWVMKVGATIITYTDDTFWTKLITLNST